MFYENMMLFKEQHQYLKKLKLTMKVVWVEHLLLKHLIHLLVIIANAPICHLIGKKKFSLDYN